MNNLETEKMVVVLAEAVAEILGRLSPSNREQFLEILNNKSHALIGKSFFTKRLRKFKLKLQLGDKTYKEWDVGE